MEYCIMESARIAYKIFGCGERTLVVDTGLGSCSAEWWHIAEALSCEYKILLYDRAGYGRSSESALDRTPRNIASELNTLLNTAGIEEDIIIIGHSQGGLYAIEYAYIYPDKVKGLILLDPATPFDSMFKEQLSAAEYKKSGVDRTVMYKSGVIITSMGLGFALKPLFKKAPPFIYHQFSSDAKDYILSSLIRKSTYKTALAEYASTHNAADTEDVVKAINNSSLGKTPIKLITHSSDFYIEELKHYGNMDEQTAEKIEHLWQDIMKKCLALSSDTEHITAQKSSHFIHLTDFDTVKNAIDGFLKAGD